MNLIIDIGNTRIKSALFEGNRLVSTEFFELNDEAVIKKIASHSGKTIISSVVENHPIQNIKSSGSIHFFSHQTQIPIQNSYKSPETLGLDRLANALAISFLSKKNAALAIDCGTCLKIDLIVNHEYLGGSISPGLKMRFSSLHNFTSKLPLIESEIFEELNGKNTKESILSGCYRGMLAEIRQTITDYEEKYPDLDVFITGGDHPFFVNHLKNRIFADPFLTLKGLNEILNYQND